MILRARLTSCRSFILLVTIGLIFLTVNVTLIWNQQQSPPHSICVCEPSINVPNLSDDGQKNPPSSVQVQEAVSDSDSPLVPQEHPDEPEDSHQLAVVVPFRNRYEEMMEFIPHIHKFLDRQKVRHQIFVINQADDHRFNRAALLNIGFLLSRNECDYMVMHDVDLLPMNDDLTYGYPNRGPFHVSSPELHPLYHYSKFIGGILIMSRKQFEQVNGLSNLFWGWGREDDELYVRIAEKGMKVQYPQGITTGTGTFKHLHDKEKRPRDQNRYFNQKEVSRRRDRKTGLNTVQYKVVSDVAMTIDNAPFHFVSVELVCDYEVTPFCDNPSH